ncbi:XkdF-like putative serine protease domain-containing protein [Bradyrhizobium sp. ORS 86]|uniref:XkdF-like putative serine protease domain-containing protein n=1 Tax=Bradyrhizobium sp. ORS 86 TaxID=1685970 RepID=UPI00388F1032
MNWFTDLFKDVTATGVHATTAIGNATRRRKQRALAVETAAQSEDDSADDGQGGIEGQDDGIVTSKFDKAQVVKVDNELGLVFGFAIVCKKDGENYFDLQGDHITETAMLKATTDFMLNSRISKEMHEGDADGSIVFAFPLTSDIAKALKIETEQTGLLVAMKPSKDVLAKYKDGTYTGFSIGGSRVKDEEVA